MGPSVIGMPARARGAGASAHTSVTGTPACSRTPSAVSSLSSAIADSPWQTTDRPAPTQPVRYAGHHAATGAMTRV